jgi:group I intron endonuclease
MCGIYKITNLINGKVYIGQSVDIGARWRKHHNEPFDVNSHQYNCSLYRAIRKYGLDYFSFEIIEECKKEDLNEREKYWVSQYNSHNKNFGYNETEGGDGSEGAEIKLTQSQILEIYELLLNTELTQQEIAQQFNVSQYYISLLNRGVNKPQEGYVYPIRPLYYNQKKKTDNNLSICPICGGSKSKISQMCMECHKKQSIENRQGKNRISREELKFLIRNKSFVEIGKMFEVTDNAVRKWCDGYNLPRTKRDIKQYTNEEWAAL